MVVAVVLVVLPLAISAVVAEVVMVAVVDMTHRGKTVFTAGLTPMWKWEDEDSWVNLRTIVHQFVHLIPPIIRRIQRIPPIFSARIKELLLTFTAPYKMATAPHPFLHPSPLSPPFAPLPLCSLRNFPPHAFIPRQLPSLLPNSQLFSILPTFIG